MAMQLAAEEPAAGPWRVQSLAVFTQALIDLAGPRIRRPVVVAVDGRSSSGKTTLTDRICARFSTATAVHTDDVAWWHSRFGWTDLLIDGVLDPILRGRSVSYRPPAWQSRSRPGSIEVSVRCDLLIIEGVGAGWRELTRWLDAVVWVQCDEKKAAQRSLARVGAPGESPTLAALHGWMSEEMPFVADQRTWEHANLIVNGAPELPYDPSAQVVVAPAFPPSRSRSL